MDEALQEEAWSRSVMIIVGDARSERSSELRDLAERPEG